MKGPNTTEFHTTTHKYTPQRKIYTVINKKIVPNQYLPRAIRIPFLHIKTDKHHTRIPKHAPKKTTNLAEYPSKNSIRQRPPRYNIKN